MELPTIDPNMDANAINSVIEKMQAMNTTNPVPVFPGARPAGMELGGFIAGGQPTFGSTKRAMVVGENAAKGDPGEVYVKDYATGIDEFIPVMGNAQGGATVPPWLAATGTPYTSDEVIKAVENTIVPQMLQTTRSRMGSNLGYGTSSYAPIVGGGYGQMSGPITIERGLMEAGTNAPMASRISSLVGNLPNPRNAAGIFSTMNPAEQRIFLSLYKLAGIDPDTFKAQLESAMIFGPERRMLQAA
jgi:hypothetical protein